MDSMPVKFIVLSDIHLYADTNKILLGVNTRHSFQAVLKCIHENEKNIDFILIAGDLTQDCSPAGYLYVADMLKTFSVPVYCIPGNHDDPKIMAQVYPHDTISMHKHIVLKDWHMVLLNTHKHQAVEGYLDESQLNYLQHCLEAYPEHHAMVVMHHQPVKVGCAWLDRLGLTNANELWATLAHYPKVNTILFGHVHQVYEEIKQNIKCISSPATCIQFMPKQDAFGLDHQPPGYRWVELYADGRMETGVKRTAEYVGEFLKEAKGY